MTADERPTSDRPGPAEKLARALGVAADTERDESPKAGTDEAERPPVADAAQADSER